jgi:hypothetical protein
MPGPPKTRLSQHFDNETIEIFSLRIVFLVLLFILSNVTSGGLWQQAKNPLHKHGIAAYGGNMADKIVVDGRHRIHHAIMPWRIK